MKSFFGENKTVVRITILILAAVVAAMSVIGARIGIEKKNKTYDVVLDYAEIEKMAEQSDRDTGEWLSEFRNMGITKVGLQEENIMTLMEESWMPVTGEVLGKVMEDSSWKDKLPETFLQAIEEKGKIDRFDVLITTGNKEATDFVREGITSRIAPERCAFSINPDGESGYFWLNGTSDTTLYTEKYKYMNAKNGGFIERIDIDGSKLMYISLGLMPEKVQQIQDQGMEVIPRTLSYNGWNDTRYAQAVIDGYERYGITPEYIIVGGEAVFGYDDGVEFAKNYILDNGITIGLIENTTQLQNIMQYGVQEAAQASGYDTVRVFSVWNYIQYRYQYYGYQGAEEIENTLFRAVTERNVRVIYFKPFLEFKNLHTYVTELSEYQNMFDHLDARLARHGFTRGAASVMSEYSVPTPIQILVACGCALGAVLLLRCLLILKEKTLAILSILGILAVLAAYFVMPNTAVLLTSFAAAVVFGCLAVTYVTAEARLSAERIPEDAGCGRILPAALRTLIPAVGIALIGGMMTAAPISSTSYMLEIDIFRGVKISQLLPIAFFAVAFLAYYGYGARKKHIGHLEWTDIKELLNLEIRVWMILAGMLIGGVGIYYIMRTGHDSSIEVSSAEMLFRNKLEELLLARPRNKEFLFAFPAVMMMVYCSVRRLKLWTLIFGLCGSVGMVSVINTFMHIRTPLYLGFARTGYSLLFGILLGTVAVLVFDGLYRLYQRFLKKYV